MYFDILTRAYMRIMRECIYIINYKSKKINYLRKKNGRQTKNVAAKCC